VQGNLFTNENWHHMSLATITVNEIIDTIAPAFLVLSFFPLAKAQAKLTTLWFGNPSVSTSSGTTS
jgi:hypothetical protein